MNALNMYLALHMLSEKEVDFKRTNMPLSRREKISREQHYSRQIFVLGRLFAWFLTGTGVTCMLKLDYMSVLGGPWPCKNNALR